MAKAYIQWGIEIGRSRSNFSICFYSYTITAVVNVLNDLDYLQRYVSLFQYINNVYQTDIFECSLWAERAEEYKWLILWILQQLITLQILLPRKIYHF